MLNCHDATRLMSESQERPLTFRERISLRLHVTMCSGCHNFKEQMGLLKLMARTYTKGITGQKETEASKSPKDM